MGVMWRAGRRAGQHRKPPSSATGRPRQDLLHHQAHLRRLSDLERWAVAPRVRPTSTVPTEGHEEPQRQSLTQQRPRDITEMVGQEELRGQLGLVIAGSRRRGSPMPHVLLSGPAGHGKTTLAAIIAHEVGSELVSTTGVVLRRPQDLAGLLLKMAPHTVLFIDEVHRMPVPLMEMLYEALEDRTLSVVTGGGTDAQTVRHDLLPFTCVAATTDPGRLSTPFRERFGFRGTVEPYEMEELAEIVGRAWERQGIAVAEGECLEVAKRCKGVPRLALHLAERVLDYSAVHEVEGVPEGVAAEALEAFGIDDQGLTRTDWRILTALCERFGGRPVGLSALAQALDMDEVTLTHEYEPPLVHAGLVQRTRSGRMALPAAFELFREEEG